MLVTLLTSRTHPEGESTQSLRSRCHWWGGATFNCWLMTLPPSQSPAADEAVRSMPHVFVDIDEHWLVADHQERCVEFYDLDRPRQKGPEDLVRDRPEEANVLIRVRNGNKFPQISLGQRVACL